MLHASCHCGAVRLEIARRPRQLTECNCSICRRYGARWAYYSRRSVRMVGARGATSVYTWGKRTLEFHRCRRCGCVTHYRHASRRGAGTLAVNARMLEPEAVAGLRIRTFDGAATWRYMD